MTSIPRNLGKPGPYGSVYLQNFKAFGPDGQAFPLSRINLFFGANSAGKSSIFKAIELVVKAYRGDELSNYRYSTTAHDGKHGHEIVLGICFKHPNGDIDSSPTTLFHFTERPLDQIGLDYLTVILPSEINLRLELIDEDWRITHCQVPDSNFIYQNCSDPPVDEGLANSYQRKMIGWLASQRYSLSDLYNALRSGQSVEDVPSHVSDALFTIVRDGLDKVFSHGLLHLQNNLIHLPPVRRIPTRTDLINYSQSKSYLCDDLEAAVWQVLLRPGRWLQDANIWMGKDGLNLGYSLTRKTVDKKIEDSKGLDKQGEPAYLVVTDNRTQARSELELDLTDVGSGISQVIPVIGACSIHNDLWVMIEQPELHLHPRIQCELGDMFIARANDTGIFNRNNVFLIETHSEHLILRMLRRIRETEKNRVPERFALWTDELAVFFVQLQGGSSRARKIDVDIEGDFIQPWPDDFFEIDFYERFATGDEI